MAIWCWLRRGLYLVVGGFVLSVALTAFRQSWDGSDFPEALAVKLELWPMVFPLHMVTGGLALLLVPLTILLRHTTWHRWAGRLAALDVVIAGLTALPVALAQPVKPVAAAGFSVQAFVWMALLGTGLWHIRRRDIGQHQSAMLMMAAVTSGAVFFRLYLALWALLGTRAHFTTFYGIDAWMAWALPLAVVFVMTRRLRGASRLAGSRTSG